MIESPEEKAEDAKHWLIVCMVKGMEEVLEEVPVTVAVAEGKDLHAMRDDGLYELDFH